MYIDYLTLSIVVLSAATSIYAQLRHELGPLYLTFIVSVLIFGYFAVLAHLF